MAAQRQSLTRPFSMNSARTVAAAVASAATGPQPNPAQVAANRITMPVSCFVMLDYMGTD